MEWAAFVSGLIALPSIAASGCWAAVFIDPSLGSRAELLPLFKAVMVLGLLALPAAAGWRWWAGNSCYANVSLILPFLTQAMNCFGFLGSVGRAAGSVG